MDVLEQQTALRERYSSIRTAHRVAIREFMGDVLRLALDLLGDPGAFQEYCDHAELSRSEQRKSSALVEIAEIVFRYSMNARSEAAIRLAWKRARVVCFLHEFRGIAPEDIADAIRDFPGRIEGVLAEAAEIDPRRRTAKKRATTSSTREPEPSISGDEAFGSQICAVKDRAYSEPGEDCERHTHREAPVDDVLARFGPAHFRGGPEQRRGMRTVAVGATVHFTARREPNSAVGEIFTILALTRGRFA